MATIFNKVAQEKIRITENGKTREVTKMEAATMQLTNKAVSGDLSALREFLRLSMIFVDHLENEAVEGPDTERDRIAKERLLKRIQAMKLSSGASSSSGSDERKGEPANV